MGKYLDAEIQDRTDYGEEAEAEAMLELLFAEVEVFNNASA